MSPTSDSTFAELQQTIDDLRQQLAERTAERDQALAREAATGEVLGVINSSPGDLAPVFDAMLENAMRLCEADFAGLWTYDGEHVHPAALHRVPPAYAEFMTRRDQPVSPNNTRARLIRGEPFVHIPDAAALPDNPLRRAFVELGGGRAQLAVPLRKDGALIGILTVYRKEPRPFSDKQIALLQNFAAQAVVAMENARLITETREALEQQTATAEVLGVINSSPGELAPVFDAMLEKAMRLCEAAFGILLSYDGEHFRHAALRSVPASYGEFMRQNPPDYGPESGPGRILAGERLVHVPDMRDTDLYRRADPNRRALVDFAGARTVVLVPLLKDDAVRGVITAFRQEVRPFTDKQIALLQNFAAQAVIAMENARLFTETREALEQQTATAEVLGVINASPGDLTPVFNAMLEKALRLCEAACGELWTYDGECARVSASRGAPSAFADFLAKAELRPGPETAPGRALQGEPVVHIADVAQEKSANPVRRAVVDLGGARTVLAVPLHKEGTPVGTFTIYRTEVRPFSEKQIALLQNFAAQAVIAIENARLITETREALEQQTATAEVLQVINSSPGDLAPVFDAILEKAARLCNAELGGLFTFDGERFSTVALLGAPREFAAFMTREPLKPSPGTGLERIARERSTVQIADLTADVVYRERDPLRVASVELGGMRSFLAVPLINDETLLGALSVWRQEVHPFTDKQIALLQNFAAQAVIAMENARLITETREALEQQTATAEVLQVINSSPGDPAPVFEAMLDKAVRLCGAAFGLMMVTEGEEAPTVASRGVPSAFAEFRRTNPVSMAKGPIFSRLLAGEAFVHTLDLKDDDAYRRGDPLRCATVDLGGGRTSLMVALRRDREVLGAIHLYRQELRPFSDKQIALLQNFAAQAVIAMENARLLGELRQRTEEVAELNRGLAARVAEQVEELGRVGRLKRFLAPQLAELIVSQGDEKILESHRREIVVVFCDLRGYTAFTETAEPEEVLDFLREYHGALGPLVSQFEGTLDQFSGDGIMVFFNDPLPIPNPAERAVNMAVAMREAAGSLIAAWRERGRDLGFGCGVAQGYATLGQIGFSERSGYTAIGTVCNVAARLCAEAEDGQILLSQRVNVALKGSVVTEQIGALALKGLTQPVIAFNVPLAASQPALRVIEGGPQNV